MYTDADFAADKSTSKSVSGVFCAMCGSITFFSLCALSKKQGAVSHSTTESEMVAADLGLRTEALHLMILFDAILKREVRLLILEDNQTTLRIITTGKNQVATTCLQDTSDSCSLDFTSGSNAAY